MIDRLQDLHRLAAVSAGTGTSQHTSPVHCAQETCALQHPGMRVTSDSSFSTPASVQAGKAAAAAALRYSRAILSAPRASCQTAASVSSASTEAPSSSRTSPSACSFPPLSSFFPSLAEVGSPDDKAAVPDGVTSTPLSPGYSSPSRTSGESDVESAKSTGIPSPPVVHADRKLPSEDVPTCPEGSHSEPPPLFAYLRQAKTLKIAISEVLLIQQRAGYLLLLHPPETNVCLPSLFCGGCSASYSAGVMRTDTSLCHNCELASHLHAAQQLLHRAHEALRQLQKHQEEEECRYMQEQANHAPHSGFFIEHLQVQHASAATAAELRIRRSVLKQQQQQFHVALEQQGQLEQDLRARWEGEVSAEMRNLCPEASSEELQEALHRIGGNTFEADHATRAMIATAAAGSPGVAEALAAKCRQLQKLGACLAEVQKMMEEMQ
ncbi:transmembrane protein, partial [Cystoisospora suis]